MRTNLQPARPHAAASADPDVLKRRIALIVPLLALGPALLMIVVFWAVL